MQAKRSYTVWGFSFSCFYIISYNEAVLRSPGVIHLTANFFKSPKACDFFKRNQIIAFDALVYQVPTRTNEYKCSYNCILTVSNMSTMLPPDIPSMVEFEISSIYAIKK